MAHNPFEQEQSQLNQELDELSPQSLDGSTTRNTNNNSKNIKTIATTTKSSTSQTISSLNKLNRSSIRKLSSSQSSATTTGYHSATTATGSPDSVAISGKYQPSKQFISKCKTELEGLLDSIKGTYHDEIRELYSNEQLSDLYVRIGEKFKKPLHRCVLVARAFKLYGVLKAFKIDEEAIEQDIIVSEFQNKLSLFENNDKKDRTEQEKAEDQEEREAANRLEALSIYNCTLPDNLISPELFLNFARRLYLDTDVTEEEGQLRKRLVDWLKQNRPELIKPPPGTKCPIDHKESFRTIQPDYEQQKQQEQGIELKVDVDGSSVAAMSSPPDYQKQATSPPQASTRSSSQAADDEFDESSQATSLTGSLLTRTETFELFSASKDRQQHQQQQQQQPQLDDEEGRRTPINKMSTISTSIDDGENTTGGDDVDSETSQGTGKSSAPYTPVTRTGLKPKTFTTPVDAKQRLARANKKAAAAAAAAVEATTASESKTSSSVTAARQSDIKTKRTTQIAAARTSSTTTPKSTVTGTTPNISAAVKPRVLATAKGKAPNLPVMRAHPISMERSQSPGTSNLIKGGTTKNFIAANKRLVAQMEPKRLSLSPSEQSQLHSEAANDAGTTGGDSELDAGNSEFSWRAFEGPFNSDVMVAQMDKFALVNLSTLADCLSKMFIGEMLADSMIEVRDGKQISAHKCILSARSAYLNDFINQKQNLATSTPEPRSVSPTPANQQQQKTQQLLKIDLSEFGYNTVYFSLLHIYSGIVKVPDDLDLEELTKLSHLLHVTTLRQVCQHNLKMNYCHFFHKPCPVCCVGVLKTLPLAWRYDYTDLYSKCLSWIGSNFASVFCLKEFSELKPNDLIEECYSATMSQLTPDNIISRTIECQKLLKNLARVKWTEPIICLVGRLLEDFCHYVAENYEKILQSESFMNLGKSCWECEVLEENLLAAMNHLKPDSGCRTLIQLHRIECSIESFGDDPKNVSDSFANLISKMRKYCERYLLKEATSVVHCQSWRLVNPSLQKRIKDQAIIATDFDEPTRQLAAKPKLSSLAKTAQASSGSRSPVPLKHLNDPDGRGSKSPQQSLSNRSTPDQRALKSPSTTYLPPPKTKTAAARHLKVMK